MFNNFHISPTSLCLGSNNFSIFFVHFVVCWTVHLLQVQNLTRPQDTNKQTNKQTNTHTHTHVFASTYHDDI